MKMEWEELKRQWSLLIQETSAGTIAALAAVVLTLSAGYWLVRDRGAPAGRGAGGEPRSSPLAQVTPIADGRDG